MSRRLPLGHICRDQELTTMAQAEIRLQTAIYGDRGDSGRRGGVPHGRCVDLLLRRLARKTMRERLRESLRESRNHTESMWGPSRTDERSAANEASFRQVTRLQTFETHGRPQRDNLPEQPTARLNEFHPDLLYTT